MIVDLNITEYIRSLMKEEKNDLSHIESEARVNHVPIVKPETKELLRTLVLLKKPMKILEVGAAVGFSSLYMNSYQPEGGTIITIERNEKRIKKAKENIKNQGKEEQITLLEGDAIEILKGLDGSFDLIFVDAAKGQYINYLPEILRLMPKGGLLITDNILQEGELVESRYVVTRRDRTIHTRIREYVYELTHNDNLITSIVPIGDGITLSVKK